MTCITLFDQKRQFLGVFVWFYLVFWVVIDVDLKGYLHIMLLNIVIFCFLCDLSFACVNNRK